MELTTAELTILGLVIEQPCHGYDLEQKIEQRGIRNWTDIGFSSIYYLLNKLEKRKLVTSLPTEGGAKSRKIFHATDTGKELASACTYDYLSEATNVPQPFLVGLANLPLLSKTQYHRALQNRLTQITARINHITQKHNQQTPLAPAAQEVFSYSLCLLEAERIWLEARALTSHDKQD